MIVAADPPHDKEASIAFAKTVNPRGARARALQTVSRREPTAAEHEAGVSAKQHFEAATAAMPRADADPEVAKKAREDASDCTRNISRLSAIYTREGTTSPSGRPLYDINKDTLNTSEGTLTLAEVGDRCSKMLAKLNVAKKLPEPAAHDAELEQAFLKAISAAYGEPGGKKYVGTILTSSDWGIVRHPDSGAVVSRSRGADFASIKNGECRLAHFSLSQEYVGSEFTGPYHIAGVGSGYDVECSAFPAEWTEKK